MRSAVLPIFDTHQHLIYADRLRYPIAEMVPCLTGRTFTYEDYFAEAEGTGIESSLFMETSAELWQEEFKLIQQIWHRPGSRLTGLVAQLPMEQEPQCTAWLEMHHNEGLRGVRRICHTEPDDFALQPSFISNVRLLAALGLTFDLCFLGRQLSAAIELAQLCPNTQMVLDHCGVPDIAGGEWDSWKHSILSLAQLENVSCKISGVLAYCRPEQATLLGVRPYIEHCLECFGWNRVVWGSDWPFCNQATTLRNWVAISKELLRGETEENQRKLFSENARRIYRVPVSGD